MICDCCDDAVAILKSLLTTSFYLLLKIDDEGEEREGRGIDHHRALLCQVLPPPPIWSREVAKKRATTLEY